VRPAQGSGRTSAAPRPGSRAARRTGRISSRGCTPAALLRDGSRPLFKLRNSDLIETSIRQYGSASSINFPIQLGPIRATGLIEAANWALFALE
jgi:hypothetical protein